MDKSVLYYLSHWQKSPLSNEAWTHRGDVVVFGSSLPENLGQEGRMVLIKAGDSYGKEDDLTYQINPLRQEDYRRLANDLTKRGIVFSRIIHMWADAKENDTKSTLESGVYSLFHLTKALMEQKPTYTIRLAYLYRGVKPVHEAVEGFARIVGIENPNFIYKAVGAASPGIALKELISSSDREYSVQYLDGVRHVKCIEPYIPSGTFSLKQNGVYIITGGAGRLGLIFADYLAKNAKATLVLTGRSELSEDKAQRLKCLEECGAKAVYIKADVSSKEDVKQLVSKTKSLFNRIDGIIHSAGVLSDSFILKKSIEEMQAVLSAKVYGTMNLDEATRDEALDFFVLFSSISSIMGNVGQSDYAYANAFMDSYAYHRNVDSPQRMLSINWPLWEEGGMDVDSDTKEWISKTTGFTALNTREGIKAFEESLASGVPQSVVLTGRTNAVEKAMEELYPKLKQNEIRQEFNAMDKNILKQKAEEYLKKILSQAIRLSPEKLNVNEPMERYGIDSIMIMNLNRELEVHFGQLSKTLFFEYQTISELAGYFVENRTEKLLEKVGEINRPQPPKETATVTTINSIPVVQQRGRFTGAGSREAQLKPEDNCMDVAIIGLSGRYPMAENVEEFWQNLKEGKDCVVEIPSDRWNHSEYYDPDKNKRGKTYAKWGGFVDDADKFDPLFFGISPIEAEFLDPQERLFLQTTWHTIEDAGYTRKRLEKVRTGVYVGVMYGQYQLYGAEESQKGNVIALSSSYASIANRVSYFFNFHGTSVAVDTMCSSSLTAIHLACESLIRGENELALAGGVNISSHPNKYILLSQGKFASTDGRCRAFGEGGDGYVPGEGVGAVLLKPLKKAQQDGDHIYAVIKATTVNHGGKTNGYSVPNPNAQEQLIIDALEKSKVNPRTISCVEAHGTGTSLGDPIEITGLSKAYGKYNKDKQYCSIGSAKANIGHLESAAGIAGLTKMLLQMKYKTFVPSILSDTLNPNIDFKDTPFYVQHKLEKWDKPFVMENGLKKEYPRRAGLSSFGAGGSNAHIILEEYEGSADEGAADEGIHLIVLSARRDERLKEYAEKMLDFIEKSGGNISLSAMAYTLQICRETMEERMAIIASDMEELKEALKGYLDGKKGMTNVFRASIKDVKDRSGLLVDGEAGEAFVNIIVRNREFHKLAQIWVSGIEVNWALLYKQVAPKPVSLPVYPFAKDRYWVANTPRAKDEGQIAKLHLLVDSNESTLEEQCFKKVLQGGDFFIKDHVIDGNMIMPGVVHLEMARAAGNLSTKRGRVGKLKDVVWSKPVNVTQGSKEVYISFYPSDKGVQFEISSLINDGRTVHSQGMVEFESDAQGKAVQKFDIDQIKQRCSVSISGDELYGKFKKTGFEYGSGFRGIKELSFSQSESLSRIELPQELEKSFDSFVLHPAVMDSALQTVAGLTGNTKEKSGEFYLPFAIGEVDITAPLERKCYAYGKESGSGSTVKKYDIYILNDAGEALVAVKGFSTRAVRQENNHKSVYLVPQWEVSHLSAVQQKELGGILIFDSNEDLSREISSRGGKVILVKPGSSYREITSGTYEINAASQKDYVQLLKELKGIGFIPSDIVHRWSKEDLTVKGQLEAGVYSLLHLSKALMELKGNGKVRLIYIYPSQSPQYTAVSGFCKTIRQENPLFAYKSLEVRTSATKLAEVVLLELQPYAESDAEVLYQDGIRYIKSLKELENGAIRGKLPLKEKGVYVITGGTGGLGLIFARYLASTVKARLVLTGRSSLSQGKKNEIEQLEKLGAEVLYIKSDVSEEKEAVELVSSVKRRFGEINGIIHSAGVLRDSIIIKKTSQEMGEVLASKVYGTLNLDNLTKNEPLDFFAVFSSTVGELGNVGQCDYAFANCFMDNYAVARQSKGHPGKSVSINWPLWKEGGMSVDPILLRNMKKTTGLVPLETQAGIKAFEVALKAPSARLMVLYGDSERIKALSKAQVEKEKVQNTVGVALEAGQEDIFSAKTEAFLKEVLSSEIKLPVSRIDSNEALENYGIDSILIMGLTARLEASLGALPKTLFFEHRTIGELAKHLMESHRDKLLALMSMNGKSSPTAQKTVDTVAALGDDWQMPQASLVSRSRKRFSAAAGHGEDSQGSENNDIAIIGISGRYPMANSPEELWENLVKGKDCVTEIPENRWDTAEFFNPKKGTRGKSYSKWGGFIDDVEKFDPMFFGITPIEAQIMDPQERLFLQAAWHVLEDSGYTREDLKDSMVGVFVGVMYGHYQLYGAEESAAGNVIALGSTYSSIANRVSYFFNFRGPSIALDTMCSSSLTSIHLACDSIRKGESEMAIAGGVNVSIHPNKYILLSQGRFFSTDGRCRAFGEGGDGYVPGEGVGALLLKPLKKALEDNDSIYGVIKATSINHGGKTNGYTVPNPQAQADVIKEALRKAGVSPSSISYIEAHGTGTSLGDPIEIAGLMKAFGEDTGKNRTCPIGSIKSNIGHLESAAGVAGITKVLMQMKHTKIVPSLHSTSLNPNIDFGVSPFYVPQKLEDWNQPVVIEGGESKIYPRRAGISSFGAGGSNAHIVIEELEELKRDHQAQRVQQGQPQLVVLSARNSERLKEHAANLLQFLDKKEVQAVCTSKDSFDVIKKELTNIAAEIINLNCEDIDDSESLFEYGADAVNLSGFMQKVNEKFNTSLEVSHMAELCTISSLAEILAAACEETVTQTPTDISLEDVAYTLMAGREAMEERLAIIVGDTEGLMNRLEQFLDGSEVEGLYKGSIKSGKAEAGMLFTGKTGKEYLNSVMQQGELDKIAHLWVSGIDIEWKLLYGTKRKRRISLPKYPFGKDRCWFREGDKLWEAKGIAPVRLTENRIESLILAKHWKESELQIKSDSPSGTVAVVYAKGCSANAKVLFKGINTVMVEDGADAAAQLLGDEKDIIGFIDISDIQVETRGKSNESTAKIMLLSRIIKNSQSPEFKIIHLARGLQHFRTEIKNLAGAEFAGLVMMLGAEYKKVKSVTVDIDIKADDIQGIRKIILGEWQAERMYSEVCYRDGKRYTPFMRKVENNGAAPIDTQKVVIITGGTRGIGAEVARHLVQKGVRKLVLMGAQQFPLKEQWQEVLSLGGSTADKVRLVEELEEKGARVTVYSGSLTDKDGLSEYFGHIREEMGVIGGVMHCAGLSASQNMAFINKEVSEIEKVFEPKVQGLEALHEVLAGDGMDFFVLFSSISALVPAMASSMSVYAAANSFMDFFASYQHKIGNTYYKSINWPNWSETGMGYIASPVAERLGLAPIPTREGLVLLDTAMAAEKVPCVAALLVYGDRFREDRLLLSSQKYGEAIISQPKAKSVSVSKAIGESMLGTLKELFANELKIPSERMDEDKSFGDFGVDSILIADLIIKIENLVGKKLEPSIMLEYPTLKSLSVYLELNFGKPAVSQETTLEEQKKEQEQVQEQEQKQEQRVEDIPKVDFAIVPTQKSSVDKIAVIGIGCHFPGADNKERYWQNLSHGVSSVVEIPKSRWSIEKYYSPEYQKQKSTSKWGGFINDIDYFDPAYFGITEEEAYHTDPLIRQFLEVSVQTIRDAGYDSKDLWDKRVGVFVGARSGTFASKVKEPIKTSIVGIGQNFIAAHASHIFNFKGPSMVVDTACSSSLVSVHLACQSIMSGESELALAGGVDLLLDEKSYLVLSEARALSPDGKCHTFDESANGFVPGEGCGAVLLKSLHKAIADGDEIYAVIESSALNNDGRTMGVTTPNPEAQAEVIRLCLEKSGINPNSISYVETHGTGTMIGDPIELKALTKVYRQFTSEKQFCGVGSVKTNFGHLLSAAGIASFIKVVLSLHHRHIPPTINCNKPNPRFKFEDSPFYPNTQLKEWQPYEGVRRAGISSFGFGGTNAHMIVAEVPQKLGEGGGRKRQTLPEMVFNKKRYWPDDKASTFMEIKAGASNSPFADLIHGTKGEKS